MPLARGLQKRLAKVDTDVQRLAALSDPDLITAGLAYAPNHASLSAQIGLDPATLSKAFRPGSKSHRPLSLPSREHLITFAALRGIRVPVAAPRPEGRTFDATGIRETVRLVQSEAARLAWLAEHHLGGLEGVALDALHAYVTPRLKVPPRLPFGTGRCPCPLPAPLIDILASRTKSTRTLARHVRAAIVAWMERQPAGPPSSHAPRQNALLSAIGEGEVVDMDRVAALTGASNPVARQIVISLVRRDAMRRLERGLYWLTSSGAAMAGAVSEVRVS